MKRPKHVPPVAFVLATIASMHRLPRRDERKLRVKTIPTKNRFDAKSSQLLTPAEIEFGAAMHKYLRLRYEAGWTPGQVLDVLMTLGYRNRERDFEICVHRFTTAINTLKRGGKRKRRRPFPSWGEVLGVAAAVGWYRPAIRKPTGLAPS